MKMLFSTILLSVSLLPLLTSGAPIRARHGGDEPVPSTSQDPKQIQGLNFLFATFSAETSCNKGQVACVKGGTATCAEDNDVFELTPCANGLTCLASPGLVNGSIPIGCTTTDAVTQALKSLGVTDGQVAVDSGVTALPSNLVIVTAGQDGTFPTSTETLPTATATATSTSTDTSVPEPTCIPDDGNDGEDDGDGDETVTIPTFQATLGDPIPTGTIGAQVPVESSCTEEPTETGTVVEPSATDLPTDPTCTEEPEDPSLPTGSTSTLTLILVPNPTAPGEFITSTFTPIATETISISTLSTVSASIETSSIGASPTTLQANIPGPTLTVTGPLVNPIGPSQIPVEDVRTIGVGEIPAKAKRQVDKQAPIAAPSGSLSHESALDAQSRNGITLNAGLHCSSFGATACVDGSIGTCTRNVDGTLRWAISQQCGDSTTCFWVPTESAAPSTTCTTFEGASALFNEAGVSSPFL